MSFLNGSCSFSSCSFSLLSVGMLCKRFFLQALELYSEDLGFESQLVLICGFTLLSLQCSYHWATGPHGRGAEGSWFQFSSWVYEIALVDQMAETGVDKIQNVARTHNFEHAKPLCNSKCPPVHCLLLVILVLRCTDEDQNSCRSQNTCPQFFHMWQWAQVVWHIFLRI